jgi:biopolymer transport protein ExbD
MARKLLQTVMLVLLVLFIVSTVAMAAEMTCTVADANGCTMAKGGDGKEEKVTAPGVKVGDKMNCDDKGTCTKKLLQ